DPASVFVAPFDAGHPDRAAQKRQTRMIAGRGEHADDTVTPGALRDGQAEDVRPATKITPPEPIADDGDVRLSASLLFGRPHPADGGREVQQAEGLRHRER